MPAADALETRLLTLLDGKGARVPFAEAVAGVPRDAQGQRPEGLPYSPWELLEHLRLAQRDLLEYCRPEGNAAGGYETPEWPADYWPGAPGPPHPDAWEESCTKFEADRDAFRALVRETSDLHAPVPHAEEEDHTYLRQLLLLADHTSYHVGQLVVVRRLLDCWP